MMKKINKKKFNEKFKNAYKNVNKEDVRNVIKKEKELEEKFLSGPLGKFFEDFKLLYSMVKDYISGHYTEVPWSTISAIIIALLYVLNPFDIIPDFIPVVGYIDDSTVIALLLNFVQDDLHSYEKWKEKYGIFK